MEFFYSILDECINLIRLAFGDKTDGHYQCKKKAMYNHVVEIVKPTAFKITSLRSPDSNMSLSTGRYFGVCGKGIRFWAGRHIQYLVSHQILRNNFPKSISISCNDGSDQFKKLFAQRLLALAILFSAVFHHAWPHYIQMKQR